MVLGLHLKAWFGLGPGLDMYVRSQAGPVLDRPQPDPTRPMNIPNWFFLTMIGPWTALIVA